MLVHHVGTAPCLSLPDYISPGKVETTELTYDGILGRSKCVNSIHIFALLFFSGQQIVTTVKLRSA